jgi:DNA-binding response OmpR family regulator
MANRKILIIDDEKLMVRSTSMVLGHFGFDVKGALNGEDGLKVAVDFIPDVILLDIMMPGMDGWQVLEKVKQNPTLKGIPVIIFTAREYSNGKSLAIEKGAADFVTKPFEPEELAATIEEILSSSRAKS